MQAAMVQAAVMRHETSEHLAEHTSRQARPAVVLPRTRLLHAPLVARRLRHAAPERDRGGQAGRIQLPKVRKDARLQLILAAWEKEGQDAGREAGRRPGGTQPVVLGRSTGTGDVLGRRWHAPLTPLTTARGTCDTGPVGKLEPSHSAMLAGEQPLGASELCNAPAKTCAAPLTCLFQPQPLRHLVQFCHAEGQHLPTQRGGCHRAAALRRHRAGSHASFCRSACALWRPAPLLPVPGRFSANFALLKIP